MKQGVVKHTVFYELLLSLLSSSYYSTATRYINKTCNVLFVHINTIRTYLYDPLAQLDKGVLVTFAGV